MQPPSSAVILLDPARAPLGFVTFHSPSQKSNCRFSGALHALGGGVGFGEASCAADQPPRPSASVSASVPNTVAYLRMGRPSEGGQCLAIAIAPSARDQRCSGISPAVFVQRPT